MIFSMTKSKLKLTTNTNAGITGAELRARRVALGMTQAELAAHLGVGGTYGGSTVARWERGVIKISHGAILRMAMDYLAGMTRPVGFPSHRPSAVR